MKGVFLILSILGVLGLALWSYSEAQKTRETRQTIARLNGDIARASSRLRILNAEWAWLNRPERLLELTKLNFPDLQLLELEHHHFIDLETLNARIQVATPSTGDE